MAALDNPSSQLRAVLGWIEGHDRCDFDAAHAYCTNDFIHEILPARVGYRFTKEELKKHHKDNLANVFTGFKTEILDVIENPGHIFLHAKTVAAPSGAMHEFNVAVTLVSDKIHSAKVFTDDRFASEYLAQIRE